MPETLKRIRDLSATSNPAGMSLPLDADSLGAAETKRITADDFFAWVASQLTIPEVSGSDGYVQFNTAGDLDSDSKFFWDKTNHRLGINTITPTATVDVRGRWLVDRTAVASLSNPSEYFLSITNFNTDGGVGYAEVSFGVASDGGLIQTLGGVDLWLNRTGNTVKTGGNVVPGTTNTLDLGTTALRWNNAYIATLTLSNALSIANGGTGQTSANAALNALLPTQTSNAGKALVTDGANTSWYSLSGFGSVSSVDISVPSIMSVSGNPITTSGTLAITLATQSANLVFAGPTSGGAATPTFRSLVVADIPGLSAVYQLLDGDLTAIAALTGTGIARRTGTNTWTLGTVVSIAEGGTGQATANDAFNALVPSQTGNSGKFLTTNATDASWGVVTAGVVTYVNTSSGLTSSFVQDAIDELNKIIANLGTGNVSQGTRLVSGGGVVWSSAYTFRVSAATYYIAGLFYSSAEQTITLDSPDGTYDRLDIIALDDTGTVVKVTGTPASSPSAPVSDPQSQLTLTIISVPTGSSSPPTVASTLIYDENVGTPTEWTATASGSGMSVNSTSNPYNGTKDCEATAANAGAYFQFAAGSSLDVNSKDNLVFYIRSKAAWVNKKSIVIYFMSSGVLQGTSVSLATGTFGFDSTNTTAYQQIVIPINRFAIPAGTTVNQLRITISGTGGTIGFYLDDIFLQTNAVVNPPSGITQDQADARYLRRSLNLSDITSASTARTNIGLGNVENTAISTWAGSTNLTTLGTIATGTWAGTTIAIAHGGTGQTTASAAFDALAPSQTGNNGKFLTTNGTTTSWATISGTGTVTSVDITLPSFLSVSGNPITTSGTLAVTLATQSANLVFAGPTSGGASAPTFRSLVVADIPGLSSVYQLLDGDLSTIAALTGTGILRRTGTNAWALDTLDTVNTWTATQKFVQDTGAGIAVIMAPATGSPTGDILQIQNNAGSTVYDICDASGNMFPLPITFNLAQATAATTGSNLTGVAVMPFSGKFIKAWAKAKTGPTGADFIVDINLGGSTIWSTQSNRLKIVAGATTGNTTTFNTTTFSAGDEITIDIDQVGSTIAGQDITVFLIAVCTNNSTNSGNSASGSAT